MVLLAYQQAGTYTMEKHSLHRYIYHRQKACLRGWMLTCLLIGIGAFVSGQVIRFRPKTIGGIIGATIGLLSFTLQCDLWTWQMLTLSLASVVALVIPGFLYKKSIRNGV